MAGKSIVEFGFFSHYRRRPGWSLYQVFIEAYSGWRKGEGRHTCDCQPKYPTQNWESRGALKTKTTILLCKHEKLWTFSKNRAQCQHVITVWTKRGAGCLVVTEAEQWQVSYGSHKEIRIPEGQADLCFKQRSAQGLANMVFSFHYVGD